MTQMTPFPVRHQGHRRTIRAQFLIQMHQVLPWAELCALIEPHCREGLKKQPAVGLERMLRIVLLEQWFGLSDSAVEEAIYDSVAMREFVGLDLNRDSVPDQSAIWRFRLVLEHRDLGRRLFAVVSQHLRAAGFQIRLGTLVEATLIAEPKWIERKNLPRDQRRPLPVAEPL